MGAPHGGQVPGEARGGEAREGKGQEHRGQACQGQGEETPQGRAGEGGGRGGLGRRESVYVTKEAVDTIGTGARDGGRLGRDRLAVTGEVVIGWLVTATCLFTRLDSV